jgi:type IV pilus assembly protein PilA
MRYAALVGRRRQTGFTLIELMIVVAIIGLLAAAAIPAYSGYITRAQVSEATGLLWSAKTPLAEYYYSNSAWPAAPSDVVGNTAGRYTASITYYGTPDDTPPGQVSLMATLVSFGTAPDIRSRTILLKTADGGSHWICSSGGTNPIDDGHLPGACR